MVEKARQDFELAQKENQSYIRDLVMQSISQAKEGKTKDFNQVCERLENKYTDAYIWYRNLPIALRFSDFYICRLTVEQKITAGCIPVFFRSAARFFFEVFLN